MQFKPPKKENVKRINRVFAVLLYFQYTFIEESHSPVKNKLYISGIVVKSEIIIYTFLKVFKYIINLFVLPLYSAFGNFKVFAVSYGE